MALWVSAKLLGVDQSLEMTDKRMKDPQITTKLEGTHLVPMCAVHGLDVSTELDVRQGWVLAKSGCGTTLDVVPSVVASLSRKEIVRSSTYRVTRSGTRNVKQGESPCSDQGILK